MKSEHYYLAQMSISKALAPLDDPMMASFVEQLPVINGLADKTPGFVWRLQNEAGNSTTVRAYEDPSILMNMSLWESVPALKEFVYRGAHSIVYKDSRRWFSKIDGHVTVLWWVPKGQFPTPAEGVDRLSRLNREGPSPEAFSFQKPFPAPEGLSSAGNESCYETEVLQFHETLAQWLGGRVESDGQALQRLTQSFSPDCLLVSPRGTIESSAALSERIGASYGSSPGIRIWITDLRVEQRTSAGALVRYIEWREERGRKNGRLASALFSDDQSSATGARWRYIHETWLAGHAPEPQ